MEDINQHFEQLRRLLVKLAYPHSIDKERICNGITTELLPLLHFGLLSQSKLLASFILDSGYDLYQKNDLRFTEGIYKLLRNEFKYNPILQCQQFLTDKGFAKRKIQFVVQCLKLGIKKHNELIKKKKLETQSKVSWHQTSLAKKVTKIIKKNHQNKATKVVIKKAPKIIKKKVTLKAPRQIIASPITEHEDPFIINDSLTADQIRSDLPQPITMQNEEEKEEKAMEISNKEFYKEDEINPVDQSMQIPQHQYDMNLIPEYDPTKYMMQTEEEQDKDDVDIKRTNHHYSASYLDTYSTLMDIPSTFLNTETRQNDNSEQKQQHIMHTTQYHDGDDDNSEPKPQHVMSTQYQGQSVIGTNIPINDDDSDDDDDDDDEDGQKQSEYQDNNDDNDESDNDKDRNNERNDVNTAMKAIMDRLDSMENKMEKQFETINARLTILEGKIKFVESKQNNNNNNGNGESSKNESIQSKTTTRVSSEQKEKEYPHHTFTSSTIGSHSLPVSLTPAPQRNTMNDRNIMSKTVPRATMPISSTIGNRFISSNNQHPKHIHLPTTAKSPFIGDMNLPSFRGRMNSPYGSTQSPSSLYQPMVRSSYNVDVNMMQYPLSDSKSNGSSGIMSVATNNGSLHVPKIESVQLSSGSTSNGNNNSNDPDSTLMFINELKEMLRSTDELLKSKPMTLYDSNV